MPHLLDIQTRAFEALLQLDAASHDREDIGLERVFKDLFPITDVHENFSLEFVRYTLGEPKYSVEECIERDMTYSAPLKATLQLVINEEVNGVKRPRNIIEKEVYLGELPLLTPLGTFVINGAERVIVSQLHRSPGVVFEESDAPERPAADLVAHHPVPRLVGRVHRRHPRRHLRPHRQEEEVPGHGAAARVRLRVELATSSASSSPSAISTSRRSARAARTSARSSAPSSPRTSTLPGEATAEDAPKARTKKAKAERERAENVLLVKEGDELTEEVYNRLRRQGIETIKVFASYMTIDLRDEHGRDRARRAPDAPHARASTSSTADGEVIAEAGQPLTDALIKKIRKAEIIKVQVFVAVGPRRVAR